MIKKKAMLYWKGNFLYSFDLWTAYQNFWRRLKKTPKQTKKNPTHKQRKIKKEEKKTPQNQTPNNPPKNQILVFYQTWQSYRLEAVEHLQFKSEWKFTRRFLMCSDQGKNKSGQCTKMGYDPSSHCILQSSWVLSTCRISVCTAMGLNKSKMSCDMSFCPSRVLKTSWKPLILQPSYKLWYIEYKIDSRVPCTGRIVSW